MTDRSNMTLLEFIEDIESRLFRTNQDTGANTNALMVWNRLREYAGMERLTRDELRQRHVDTSSSATSVEELKRFEKWMDDYHDWQSFPAHKMRYDAIMAAGGREGLMARLESEKDKNYGKDSE